MNSFRLMLAVGIVALISACNKGKESDTNPPDDSNPILDDLDGDGFAITEGDCDDNDPAVNPGATEICDGVDNNCDDEIDTGIGSVWYQDADGDGFGDAASSTTACEAPTGYVDNDDDCNDLDPRYNPDAEESDCTDPEDYNCDGQSGASDLDADGYAACEECDDTNPDINPGESEVCDGVDNDCDSEVDEDAIDISTWYQDADSDGYGVEDQTLTACDQPASYTRLPGDCNDGDAAYNPGATESCTDSEDYNCDGSVGFVDADGDGYAACEECDDSNASINPDAIEICDSVDNNCDGSVDTGAVDAGTWYSDADGDSYGDDATAVSECSQPVGTVSVGGDCNDADGTISPDSVEICDGVDNDCSGLADDPGYVSDGVLYYADADGDGYGDDNNSMLACSAYDIYSSLTGGDCDDQDGNVNAGSTEICDNIDNNCDGIADEDAVDRGVYYLDADGDSFGDASNSTLACSEGGGYVADGSDCDDSESSVYPGGTEVCDGLDNDCSGTADDNVGNPTVWYADNDSDGYGDSNSSTTSCTQPGGTSATGGDCDDTDSSINPGAVDVCDGLDNDCSGVVDDNPSDGAIWYMDGDSDGLGDDSATLSACNQPSGYVAVGGDCDDSDAGVGIGLTVYTDSDGDGYGTGAGATSCTLDSGFSEAAGDCDDGNAAIYPGASEVCDGVDEDCDGTIDNDPLDGTTHYQDADGDGYGEESGAVTAIVCSPGNGWADNTDDCNDTEPTVYLGASEADDLLDNDCDGYVDEDFLSAGDIIISEVTRQPYVNGTVTNAEAVWFEVYNTSSRTIDMSNWYFGREASAVAEKGVYVDPLTTVILDPGDYAVFCKSDNYETPQAGMGNIPYPLSCDYVWGETTDTWHNTTLNLQRDEDRLFLYLEGDDATGWLMDEVHWYYDAVNGYWPRQSQASMTLDPLLLNSVDNDVDTSWCFTTENAAGTFTKDGNYRWWDNVSSATDEYGTPGAANYDCP